MSGGEINRRAAKAADERDLQIVAAVMALAMDQVALDEAAERVRARTAWLQKLCGVSVAE